MFLLFNVRITDTLLKNVNQPCICCSEIFEGLDIESEMQKIDNRSSRRKGKKSGWDDEIELDAVITPL